MKFLSAFIIIIFFSFSYGAYVSTNTIKKVESKYGRFAKNRFVALNKFMKDMEGKSELEKVREVNKFYNQVPYMLDIKAFGKTDYWATPNEFLGKDKGDCEDYVIAKYFALRKLGIKSSQMYLTYVRVKNYNLAHMVLTYFPTPKSEPYVLDNLNKIFVKASKRKDLTPVFNFNPSVLKDGKKTNAHRKWDELLKNMKENKI